MSKFQHVTHIGDKLPITILEDNIKSFLDWGFLNIGAFVNVNIPTSGLAGGDLSQLKIASDQVATTGTVWTAPRKDWIYETGVFGSGNNPINISGIYINNNFIPGPTGNSSHAYRINYPLGQIIFSSSKPSNSNIKLNYSYRYIQIYKANESVWWKELQDMVYKSNNNTNIMANHTIQPPTIVVETIARNYQTPYQLGSTENIITQDLLLHVFTENPVQRNNIVNILLLQKDKQSFLYDVNRVIKEQKFGLNYRGEKNNTGLNYDQLISEYRFNSFYIDNAVIIESNTITSSLYNGVVRWSLKIFP